MREIPGFPGYYACRNGMVYSRKSNKHLNPKRNRNGYMEVCIRVDGAYKTCRVHRLIALAYMGESELEVNHIDGVKSNNALYNLEYVTKAQNQVHRSQVLKVGLTSVALAKDGVGYWWPSHIECIADTGLSQQSVSALHTGARKSAKGWHTTMFNEM